VQKAVGQPVADCVYGSNARLHAKLQADQYRYVLAVRCTEAIEIQTPTGRVRMTVAEADARAHSGSRLAPPQDRASTYE
jgi:hypothetical protein